MVNAWLLYRRQLRLTGETKYIPLVNFRTEVARALLTAGKVASRKRGRPSTEPEQEERACKRERTVKPVDDARYDCVGHWPEHSTDKHRCALCKVAKSRVRCMKCNVALCLTNDKNHFEGYHRH